MKRICVEAGRIVLLSLYLCFTRLPSRRRIVCLSRESNHPTTDFKLIAQYVRSHHPDYQVVILAKRLDNPIIYVFHMLRQLYYIATSEAVVLDTYAIIISLLSGHIRVPVIQMWHALGNMKRFGYTALGDTAGRSAQTARLMRMHQGYSSVLISSRSFMHDYAAGFGISESIIVEAPLPRTDLLLNRDYRANRRSQILRRFPQLGRKKNIVYCPTFRQYEPSNRASALKTLVDSIDFSRYNLILKAHPLDGDLFDDNRVLQHYPIGYDMLFIADYVISDYSTVIYEAGLMDIPVYLYAYDWPEYSSKRSLYIDLERDVPAMFTNDAHAIVHAIEQDDFDHEAYRKFVMRNVAVPSRESCTERIVNHIFDLIECSEQS